MIAAVKACEALNKSELTTWQVGKGSMASLETGGVKVTPHPPFYREVKFNSSYRLQNREEAQVSPNQIIMRVKY